MLQKLLGSGPTIRIGQESWCLPYDGFFLDKKTFANNIHIHIC